MAFYFCPFTLVPSNTEETGLSERAQNLLAGSGQQGGRRSAGPDAPDCV
jgi:hypothetical protein